MNFYLSPVGMGFLMCRKGLFEYGDNALAGNPLIEVCRQEPDPRSAQSYERDATFLYEASHESFRATQTVRRGSNV